MKNVNNVFTSMPRTASEHGRPHIRANGVSRHPKNGYKIKKRKHAKKDQFSMFMLYFESNQGREV